MSFVIKSTGKPAAKSPLELFNDLEIRDPLVKEPWHRQGQLLEAYAPACVNDPDVAVELPTGAGKTLVGLLIAEWRRRALRQRVVYLCPTKQLANQVASKAHDYGIDVVTLTGRQRDWPTAEFTKYERASAIAISTYHGLFNTSPKLESPQTIVLDDAHAAEDAVASLWSINARRGDETSGALYHALVAIVLDSLPIHVQERLRDAALDPRQRRDVELVPVSTMAQRATEIVEAIATNAAGDASYVAQMLDGNLGNCMLYVSWSSLLLRPFLPPTQRHAPYAGAVQRIYMSATLGTSGELERSFGAKQVKRIKAGDALGSSGRRLFLFPNGSMSQADADDAIKRSIRAAGRAVVIAPSFAALDSTLDSCAPEDADRVMPADVENDLAAFTSKPNAVLGLANRYDGLDFANSACRLIVLSGLPANVHHQERFLLDKLRATEVLGERIRTRITQGAGRCTRNSSDFAVVLVRGADATTFCSRTDQTRSMSAELQAEIEFGLDNAENPVDIPDLVRLFLSRDPAWQPAEDQIKTTAAELERLPVPGEQQLQTAAPHEVEAWRRLWAGDLEGAINATQRVTDTLEGQELRPYHAWWAYLGASWAHRLAEETGAQQWADRRDELMKQATGAALLTNWRPRIPGLGVVAPQLGIEDEGIRAHRAETHLRNKLLGRGARFEGLMRQLQENLASTDSGPFEEGLKALGLMLGFEAVRPNDEADPDSIWFNDPALWLTFEAKTEETSTEPIPAKIVRQANTHHTWTINTYTDKQAPDCYATILVSPREQVGDVAAKVSGDHVFIVEPEVLQHLAHDTIAVMRSARSASRGLSRADTIARIWDEFKKANLADDDLLERLCQQPVEDS